MTSYGIGLFGTEPVRKLCDLAVLAEKLDFSNVWVGDSQMIWREAYVTLGALAAVTTRVVLGSGVTNMVTRNIGVLASAWTSLAEMTNGRVICGVGTGDSSLRTMSIKPQTLSELKNNLSIFKSLLLGDETVTSGGEKMKLNFCSKYMIPTYIAASGPKILELAGKIADGVILLVGTDPLFISAGIDIVRKGAEMEGRNPKDVKIMLWIPASINENGKVARDTVRAHVARVIIRRLPIKLNPAFEQQVEKIRNSYDYYHHMDVKAGHAELVPDELVDKFALAGTIDEVKEQMRNLAKQDIDHIAFVPYSPNDVDRASIIQQIANSIP